MTINQYGVTSVEFTGEKWMSNLNKETEDQRLDKFFQILHQIGERFDPKAVIERVNSPRAFICTWSGFSYFSHRFCYFRNKIPQPLPKRQEQMISLAQKILDEIFTECCPYMLKPEGWQPSELVRVFYEDVISILNEKGFSYEVYVCKYNESIYIFSDFFKKSNGYCGVLRIGRTRNPDNHLNLCRSYRKKEASLFPDGVPVMKIGFFAEREFYNKDDFIKSMENWRARQW